MRDQRNQTALETSSSISVSSTESNQQSPSLKPRVVKIAPGENARHWSDCLKNGYICLGWEEVGDIRQYKSWEEFREVFARHFTYNGSDAAVTRKAKELWTFRELRPGDIVIANKGLSEILAIGTVVAPGYVWRADRNEYNHTVGVDWDTSLACTIAKQRQWAMVTVSDGEEEVYRQIVAGSRKGRASGPSDDVSGSGFFEEIRKALREAGLSYSDEILSAYLLSLQAKRFVILSGISGTGKTQLALAAARKLGTGRRTKEMTVTPAGAFALTTWPYHLKYNRLILPKAIFSAMRLSDALNEKVKVEVEWPGGRRRLSISAANKDAYALLFSGDFREWFQSHCTEGAPFYIELLDDGDDAPSRLRFGIPKKTAAVIEEEPRYAVMAVRPDWTDNRGLLGYYNPILQEYVTTEFLRLLLRAESEERNAKAEGRKPLPYFVILDEMNLARVEQYFSDFLSALESGEPIELHNDDEVEAGEKSDDVPVPKRLRIPNNLFFTGTVNVDETTYMFSPKVLDRAFVMELNQVDLESFSAQQNDSNAGSLRIVDMPMPLSIERPPSIEDWDELGTLLDGHLRKAVVDLHRLLERDNRHFGYRVANEIARFVCLSMEQTGSDNDADTGWAALDWALVSKVLPKLHNTQQELEDLLASLLEFAITTNIDPAKEAAARSVDWFVEDGLLKTNVANRAARLPRTGAKLHRMAMQLRRRGFASFIE